MNKSSTNDPPQGTLFYSNQMKKAVMDWMMKPVGASLSLPLLFRNGLADLRVYLMRNEDDTERWAVSGTCVLARASRDSSPYWVMEED